MIAVRKKYNRYTDYAHATIHDILPDTTGALKLHVNHLSNSFVENLGNGKFTLRPLPVLAQMAPVYGMVIEDVNQDGNLDVLINGNDYGNEITNGHYDALHGLVLLGNGKAEFQAMNLQQSGFFIPGDGKALAKIIIGNTYGLAASQNKGALKVFGLNQSDSVFNFGVDDIRAVVHLRDGRKRTHEFYFGDSFLSQSSRTMLINKSISQIEVFDNRGGKRTISF